MPGDRASGLFCAIRARRSLLAATGAAVIFGGILASQNAALAQTAMAKDASPAKSANKSASKGKASRNAVPEARLEAATFADLPGWEADDHLKAFKTFVKSCNDAIRMAERPTTRAIAQCRVPGSVLAAACRLAQSANISTKAAAKAFFESNFAPHRVVHAKNEGLLTGYYEPVMQGSRTRQGKFQTPVYRRPTDLVNLVDEADRASKQAGLTHVRRTSSGTSAYPTRAEIEQGALDGKGLELLYLEDAVEAFFMHIQGSGRVELTDGTTVRINYDGKNGHPYSSIGRYLIENDILPANRMSMQALSKWLREDKERGQKVMWQNQSYVFFRELADGDGPMGAMQVELTPGRSLAVDPAYHALGTPIYLSVPGLKGAKKDGGFHRLMVAQDVGSAIKGAERGDIYFGSGKAAGKQAGTTRHAGNFFVLLPVAAEAVAGQGLRFGEHLQWQTTVKSAR